MKLVVSNKNEDKPDYNSICSAIDNDNEYDQIYIKPGNYNVFFTISKNIQLIGDGEADEINIYYKYDNNFNNNQNNSSNNNNSNNNNSDKAIDNLIFITETCQIDI